MGWALRFVLYENAICIQKCDVSHGRVVKKVRNRRPIASAKNIEVQSGTLTILNS